VTSAARRSSKALRARLTPDMAFPLRTIVAQGTAHARRPRAPARTDRAHLFERGEMGGSPRPRLSRPSDERRAPANHAPALLRLRELPMAIQSTAGLLDDATPSAITIKVDGDGTIPADANDRDRKPRLTLKAAEIRPTHRRIPERRLALHLDAAAHSSIWCRRLPERASSTRPVGSCAPECQQRCIETGRAGEQQAIRHQVSGV